MAETTKTRNLPQRFPCINMKNIAQLIPFFLFLHCMYKGGSIWDICSLTSHTFICFSWNTLFALQGLTAFLKQREAGPRSFIYFPYQEILYSCRRTSEVCVKNLNPAFKILLPPFFFFTCRRWRGWKMEAAADKLMLKESIR